MPGGDVDDNEAVETLTVEAAEAMAAAQVESDLLKNMTSATKLTAAATHAHRFGPPTVEVQGKIETVRDKAALKKLKEKEKRDKLKGGDQSTPPPRAPKGKGSGRNGRGRNGRGRNGRWRKEVDLADDEDTDDDADPSPPVPSGTGGPAAAAKAAAAAKTAAAKAAAAAAAAAAADADAKELIKLREKVSALEKEKEKRGHNPPDGAAREQPSSTRPTKRAKQEQFEAECSVPLPPGWTAHERAGKTFYFERSTGKKQWKHPLAKGEESDSPSPPPPPPPQRVRTSPPPLPPPLATAAGSSTMQPMRQHQSPRMQMLMLQETIRAKQRELAYEQNSRVQGLLASEIGRLEVMLEHQCRHETCFGEKVGIL